LNWLDIVLLLILGVSVAGGIAKGFARLVVGLLATVAGFLCALWFYGSASGFLLPYVSHKGIANFIGFLLIFLGMVLLGALVGKLLGLLLKWAGLSWLNRLMGGVFGVLRGLVFAIALVLALLAFSPKPPPRSVVDSRIAPYVIDAAHICANLAPREVRDGVMQSYEKVKEAWAEVIRKARPGAESQGI
jgi:membrane protein required for colicin V production